MELRFSAPTGRQIPFLGHQYVDDLPELIDRPVQIDPSTGNFYLGLVGEPPVTEAVPARPGRVDQQRRAPLYPAIDGDVIDLDPAFDQQLLDISIRQAVTQLPTHHQHDHIWREAEPGEA
jgi:hypothetical protein